MKKLFSIIQKNYRIFIRSKVSALIIFLGPLLLVSLIGLSFSNTQLPGLTVGVHTSSYSELTNSVIEKIKENKFNIEKFDSKEACSNAVKKGDAGICLEFPANMDKSNNEVTFVIDYSKINLVWIVLDIINNRVSERATELRQNYATDLITKVIQTRDDLTTQKTNVDTLSTKQTEAKDTLGTARTELSQIDPSTDFSNDVTADTARSSISSIKSNLGDAKSHLSDAKSAVDGSSMSDTEKGVVNEAITKAKASITTASLYLEGNSSVKSLEYIVSTIDSALQLAKVQLEEIGKHKTSVDGSLTTLQASIDDSITAVNSVNAAVADILSRIESVQSSDTEQLVSPIKTKIEPVTTQETHFNYLFPTLIVLVIMITAVLISSTLVMNEKKSKSVFRNYITPTSELIFNVAIFLTSFSAIMIQLVIFLLVSFLFFSTSISSIGTSILVLFLITSAFILLGMIIGYLFKSEETYVLASITVSALLLFLSSTVMPIESISNSVRAFASVTPFVVSENLLRQAMFFKFGLGSLIVDLSILIGYIIIFFGVIVAVHRMPQFKFQLKKREVKK